MYDEIGCKIKGLAKIIFIAEAILFFVGGLAIIVFSESSNTMKAIVALIAFLGIASGWITSWFLYGFGEIIDKLCNIERNTKMIMKKSKNHTSNSPKIKNKNSNKNLRKNNEDNEEEDESGIAVTCPRCKEELFFDEGTTDAKCPYCDCDMVIERTEI